MLLHEQISYYEISYYESFRSVKMKMQDMKIGVKLSIGFGIILLLLIIISVYNINRFLEAKAISNTTSENEKNYAFMLSKEIDHLNWMSAVTDLFLKEDVTSLNVQTDDHKCGLGQWLYGEELE